MDGRKVEGPPRLADAERRLGIACSIRRLLALFPDEPTVLREACELLAHYRRYPAVAIAYAVPDGAVELVAAAGPRARPDICQVRARWDREGQAEGSIGPAIRTGRPTVLGVDDPGFEPWREAAQGHGIAAVVSLPLRIAENVAGALSAYVETTDALDDEEIHLLTMISEDVGRAIEAVRMRLLLAESATRSTASLGRPETLWRLSSDPAADVEQQARAILAEGARTLGLAFGVVERVEGERIVVEWSSSRNLKRDSNAAIAAPIPYDRCRHVLYFGCGQAPIRPFTQEDRLYVELLAAFFGRLLERRRQQEELVALIVTDHISGLSTRAHFLRQLEDAVLDPKARATGINVMLLGVDRFRDLRVSVGRVKHERMVRTFSDRLRGIVGGHARMAYLAEGEFAVAADGPPERGEQLARVLGEAIGLPLHLDGREMRCTASIGVALFPGDAETPESLVDAAAAALVRAQNEGGATVRFFSEAIGNALRLRRAMLQGLRFAVQRDEFELHYQPTIDLADNRVSHVEALLRWRDPQYGLRLPADFIAMAEESEAVLPIDEWVMREVIHRSGVMLCGARRLRLSFNLSGSAVAHAGTLELLGSILRDEGADPATLELEISERIASRDVAAARRLIDGCHGLGMRVTLDDFGTGSASLALIKQLPVDTLKIDGSFVRDVARSAEDAAIVRATIALGKSLGRRVVAQRVESEETARWLAAERCDAAQGYWLSGPLPQEEFLSWLSMHE